MKFHPTTKHKQNEKIKQFNWCNLARLPLLHCADSFDHFHRAHTHTYVAFVALERVWITEANNRMRPALAIIQHNNVCRYVCGKKKNVWQNRQVAVEVQRWLDAAWFAFCNAALFTKNINLWFCLHFNSWYFVARIYVFAFYFISDKLASELTT